MKHIGTKEARDKLHQLLTNLQETGEPIMIEKKGEPVAAVISSAEYRQIEKVLSLLEILKEIPIERQKRANLSIRELFGSLKPDRSIKDWKEAERIAKEEHFSKKD